MMLETFHVTKLVGIWVREFRVHILRQHAGLDMLDIEEFGIEEEVE